MKCRDICCQGDQLYDFHLNRCRLDETFGKDYCFSIFIKLIPRDEYTLRETQLKQSTNLLRIKSFVTDFLEDQIDVVKEIRLFPKLQESPRNPFVEYLVAQLMIDTEDADVFSRFINNMNADIDIKDLNNENSMFKSSLAVYDIISDVNGKLKLLVPKYNSLEGDLLLQLDLSASAVYRQFVGKDADNTCLTKEIRTLRKTDILPFIKVGLNEFSMHVENGSLVLNEEYLKKAFTSFEYEVHHDVIHLFLEDFVFIYDIMPKDDSHIEISGTSVITKPYLISAECTYVACLCLLLS